MASSFDEQLALQKLLIAVKGAINTYLLANGYTSVYDQSIVDSAMDQEIYTHESNGLTMQVSVDRDQKVTVARAVDLDLA